MGTGPHSNRQKPLAAITGASSGIGAAFARKLAERGYDLLLVARDRERLERMAGALAELGGKAEVLVADLSEHEPLREVERRLSEGRGLSLLVNNAWIGGGADFEQTDADFHERMIRVHVLAPVRLVHAALPRLKETGGAVINVSSLSAFFPTPESAVYSATKAFINLLTESLSLELSAAGVRVQALCPGFTHTDLHRRAELDISAIPARLWMEADDVVEASLSDLERGRVLSVPGLANKAIAALAAILPRRLLRASVNAAASRGSMKTGAASTR